MDTDLDEQVPRWFHIGLVLSVVLMADIAVYVYCGILPALAATLTSLGALAVWLRTTYRAESEPRNASVPTVISAVALLVLLTESWHFNLPALVAEQSPWSATVPARFDQNALVAMTYAEIGILLAGAYLSWIRHPLGGYLAWLAFLTGTCSALFLWGYALIAGFSYVPGMVASLATAAAGVYGIRILRADLRAAHSGAPHATH